MSLIFIDDYVVNTDDYDNHRPIRCYDNIVIINKEKGPLPKDFINHISKYGPDEKCVNECLKEY